MSGMVKYLLGRPLLTAGCAADHGMQAHRDGSSCPARYTLACEVSPQNGFIIPSTCVCVQTSQVKSLVRSYPAGPMRGFRSRARNR